MEALVRSGIGALDLIDDDTIIPKKYRTATVCRKAIEKLKIKSVADEVRKDPFFFALLHPALYDHDIESYARGT